MNQSIKEIADKYNLVYSCSESASGFEGEITNLHMVFYHGKDMYGGLSMPMIAFIEEDGYYYIHNGIDTVFTLKQVGNQIKLWCELYGIVEGV